MLGATLTSVIYSQVVEESMSADRLQELDKDKYPLYVRTPISEPAKVRTKFMLDFPIHKRLWRLAMLILKGWCYFD